VPKPRWRQPEPTLLINRFLNMSAKTIIPPVDRALLKAELTDERFVRYTNFGHNKIYIINYHNAPNVMLEIGRLREISFRQGGGGTGEEVDIDYNDTCEVPYEQLIVWDEREEEITGGYRFILCGKAFLPDGTLNLSTAHLFHYSEQFVREYVPYTIELGRSWVHLDYLPSAPNRKGMFSLDNLWEGLGSLSKLYPQIKYFFGKVTMYPGYNIEARDTLMAFLFHYCPDPEHLVWPINPLKYQYDIKKIAAELFEGHEYKKAYRVLNHRIRELGENIPPLINSYMNLSPSMRVFGTAVNDLFGDVEETGIMITIADLYEAKRLRYIEGRRKVD
jgi:Acetyltransferase (GNAT) domain